MKVRPFISLLASLLLAFSSSAPAAPIDFRNNPINCFERAPPGAVVTPIDCTSSRPRVDGYEFHDITYTALLFALPPAFAPVVVAWDSDRAFFNPVNQDLFVFIFGNTDVIVGGLPVTFFVTGTLDGQVVVSFTTPVAGPGDSLAWSVAALVPDVPAGEHKLDMEFGVEGFASQVTISSLYRVTVTAVPAPGTGVLLLSGALLLLGVRRKPQR